MPATSPTTSPSAAPTASPGAGSSRGTSGAQQLAAIRQCLEAAGLPLSGPFPTNMDEVAGTGGRRIFADPKVQAALKACGITVPTFRPRPSGQGQGQVANASPPAQ